MRAKPESYFPSDYRQARQAFIAAAEAAGTDVIARVHPAARGPDGRPLFLDTAALGPRDATRALLLISGTHGVEGAFGSGAQTGLLREGVRPPQGARIVMVHALNPYGFAWDRRVNEDNVDINRNFVDHAAPPANPEYDLLAAAIAPRDLEPATLAAANRTLLDYGRTHGLAALQAAVSRGQYRHPEGLWFGGRKECWSLAMLRAVLTEDLRAVRKLTVIDFHTGLGESGAGELITEALPGNGPYARARAIWGEMVKSSDGGESLSPALTGTLDRALAAWLPDVELTFAALEVGTRPLHAVFDALRRDNWLHNFAQGPDPALAAAIARGCRDAFYVDAPDWKNQVFGLADRAVRAALAAL
jgi:hypothetical protein